MKLESLRVLLVEDEDSVREAIKFMLEEMGITRISEEANGLDALKYIDNNFGNTDMIICDWNLPQKNGIELLREIRQTHPKLPFIMVTARSDKDSVQLAVNEHITDYIAKPISFDQLQSKIKNILYR